jgi:hypothetical protein
LGEGKCRKRARLMTGSALPLGEVGRGRSVMMCRVWRGIAFLKASD